MSKGKSNPPILFHSGVFGKNIKISSNGVNATRIGSFNHGIVITNRPVGVDEHVFLKLVSIEKESKWLTSFALGFTTMDPNRLKQADLKDSMNSTFTNRKDVSLIRSITSKLHNGVIIELYFNQNGAFYVLDGSECDLGELNMDAREMWIVIDIRGDVSEVEWTVKPEENHDTLDVFDKYQRKPQMLPIKYFTNIAPSFLQPVQFFNVRGPEIDVLCENKVACRRNVGRLTRPYVFVDLPMECEDEIFIRVLSVDHNFRTMGLFCLTNSDPNEFLKDFNRYLTNDPNDLIDRGGFWIFLDTLFDEKTKALDEFRIKMEKSGTFMVWKNNEAEPMGRVLSYSDGDLKYYPFFFLDGRVKSIALFGLLSKTKTPMNFQQNAKAPEQGDENLCKLCLDNVANCLLVPCHHIFFCSNCRPAYETRYGNVCPNDRRHYDDVIEIASE